MKLMLNTDSVGRIIYNLENSEGIPQQCPRNPGSLCGSWCPLFKAIPGTPNVVSDEVCLTCVSPNVCYELPSNVLARPLTPAEPPRFDGDLVDPLDEEEHSR